MAESLRWSGQDVAERLKDLFADDAQQGSTGLLDAAAVLVSFDPDTLRPFGSVDDLPAAREQLLAVSESSRTLDGQIRWSLGRHTRRERLRRLLDEKQIESALGANPDRDRDVTQAMLEGLLLKPYETPTLKGMAQVRAGQLVADWLTGLVSGVPDPISLRNLAEREAQLAPFRELVGDYFAGRTHELAVLADYVDILTPTSVLESVTRTVRSVLSIVQEPPLFVFGPGGIGKSTLIAKFLLNHVDDLHVPQFPYAYLDLDRPGLVAEEPITLLIEALRQLSMQYPEGRASLFALQQEWSRRINDTSKPAPRFATSESPSGEANQSDGSVTAADGASVRRGQFEGIWSSLRLTNRDYYLESFAEAVRALQPGSQPMLLVIDTFEEVQLRSEALVGEVFVFLDQLQRQMPFLRTVVCGRIKPESHNVKALELKTFDAEAAAAYLVARVQIDRGTATRIARQVTGSPLTLKLAVDLLRRFQAVPGGLKDLDVVIGELHKGSVEAQLYTRVVKHIADEDVKKIAYPGLVVRRITPEIIEKVLAAPCGLSVPTPDAANALWSKLKAEVVLVTERSSGVLVHRPELRAVMLGPLRVADQSKVTQIHEAAIRYYEQRPPNPEDRAEEIYHRLSLGFDRATLERRWLDGTTPFLIHSLTELAPRAQGFLAARLEVALDPSVHQQVDREDWEPYAIREVTRLLRVGQLDDALAMLNARTDISAPELRLLQVEALQRSGKQEDARQVAVAILKTVPPDSDTARMLNERFSFTLVASDATETVGMLGEALTDAFEDDRRLRELLEVAGLGEYASQLPASSESPRRLPAVAFAIASMAAAEKKLAPLVLTARRARPGNARLWEVADELGLLARGLSDVSQIQKTVFRHRRPGELRAALTRLEAQTCLVSSTATSKTFNTGFLVGPDLVLTSVSMFGDRTVERDPKRLREVGAALSVTFDQWITDSTVTMEGIRVGAAEDWLIAHGGSPSGTDEDGLGYVLLRLAGRVGHAPGADGEPRGWITLDREAHPPPKSAVAAFRFDSRGALLFSLSPTGMRTRDESRRRLQYEIEGEAGGSGSPILDDELRVVALHVARVTSLRSALTARALREGTPSDLILRDLSSRGIRLPPGFPPSSAV